MADRGFSWFGDQANIVIPDQAAIAVHFNPRGDIVIRQRQDWPEEQDAIIILARAHAGALAQAILAAVGDGGPGPERDVTGAERQRRYRERHHNGAIQESERHKVCPQEARHG